MAPITVRLIDGMPPGRHRQVLAELGAASEAVVDELLSFRGIMLAIAGVPLGMHDEVRSAAARSGVAAQTLSHERLSLVISGQYGSVRELCDLWMQDPVLVQLSGPILQAINTPPSVSQQLVGAHRFDLRQPLVMGILNVTPDSFSDGGQFLDPAAAISHAEAMVEAGADVIDVGGASSRPGASVVPAAIEAKRITPVIAALATRGIAVSVDTYHAQVARDALDAGAVMVNDITGLTGDPAMAQTLSHYDAPVIVMHMQGTPQTMQHNPHYEDLIAEVRHSLLQRCAMAQAQGIARERLWIDPGIGFGKTAAHNLTLLQRLSELTSLGYPTAVGASRKSFLGMLTGRDVAQRDNATAATTALAVVGGAKMIRVHNVAAARDVVAVVNAVANAEFC